LTVSRIKIAIITIYLSIASPLIGSEVEYVIKENEVKNLAFIAECDVDPKCDTSSKEFFEKYKKLVEEQTKELHKIIQKGEATYRLVDPVTDTIQRAQLTTNIKDREPVDDISSYVTGSEVIFYTELVAFPDKLITHEWYYEGELQTSVNLEIDALSGIWRTWSSKRFQDTNIGNWFVLVRGEQGQILYRLDFIFRGL
jgi:hypothetical protein